jgi:hypothetical protein
MEEGEGRGRRERCLEGSILHLLFHFSLLSSLNHLHLLILSRSILLLRYRLDSQLSDFFFGLRRFHREDKVINAVGAWQISLRILVVLEWLALGC